MFRAELCFLELIWAAPYWGKVPVFSKAAFQCICCLELTEDLRPSETALAVEWEELDVWDCVLLAALLVACSEILGGFSYKAVSLCLSVIC